jgi:hypothetical protein
MSVTKRGVAVNVNTEVNLDQVALLEDLQGEGRKGKGIEMK